MTLNHVIRPKDSCYNKAMDVPLQERLKHLGPLSPSFLSFGPLELQFPPSLTIGYAATEL